MCPRINVKKVPVGGSGLNNGISIGTGSGSETVTENGSSSAKKFVCSSCGSVFATKFNLKRHVS
jgi:hypothetical protein